LRIGARLALSIEIEPALAFQFGRQRKLEDRIGPFFDAADRRGARLPHMVVYRIMVQEM